MIKSLADSNYYNYKVIYSSYSYNSYSWSLQSFIWVSWGYLPSIYILCKPQFCQFLLPFFVVICSRNTTCISFILVVSYPILFCLFLCLFSTFPASLLSPLSFFAYPVLYLSHCLFLCLSSTIFLASLLLSFFTCLSLYIFFFLFCFPFVCVVFGVFFCPSILNFLVFDLLFNVSSIFLSFCFCFVFLILFISSTLYNDLLLL